MDKNYKELFEIIKKSDIGAVGGEVVDTMIDVLLGDSKACDKLVLILTKNLGSIREAIILAKFYFFLKGTYRLPDDGIKLSNTLFGNESTRRFNAMRVLENIERVDNERSLEFIISATRSLLNGLIDNELYFRICKAIVETLYEDLIFLRDNVFSKTVIRGNIQVHSLVRTGLMTSVGIDANLDIEEQEYAISDLGRLVDQYAISIDDEEHWKKHSKRMKKK